MVKAEDAYPHLPTTTSRVPSLSYSGSTYGNGTEITSLIYNGTKLFFERMKARFRTWSSWMKQAAYF